MSLVINNVSLSENFSLTFAPEIANLINEAFWPSHKVFLDENNPLSKLRVSEEYIKTVMAADDKELYLLSDTVHQLIVGTILLQKDVEGEPGIAKFNLLARNPKALNYKHLNIGDLLMNHVIKRVEQLGKTQLKIEVVDWGEDSNKLIAYYEQRGFAKTGKVLEFPRKHCLKPNNINKVCLVELYKNISQ